MYKVLAVVILAMVGILALSYGNKETHTSKVLDKERIYSKENSYYLIYTEDGSFKLEDELFYGNFRSSDWYGKIQEGETYTFTTIGFRIGVFSSYPNIVNIEGIE